MAPNRSKALPGSASSPGPLSILWGIVVWVMLVAPTIGTVSKGHVFLNHTDTIVLQHDHGFTHLAEHPHDHAGHTVAENPGHEPMTTTGWLHDLMHHAQCSLPVFGPDCVQLPLERLTTLVNLLPIPVNSEKVQGIAAELYRPPISA